MSGTASFTDPPLCGDPTCQSPGCQASSLAAWFAQQERDAHDLVWSLLGLSHEYCDHDAGCGALP